MTASVATPEKLKSSSILLFFDYSWYCQKRHNAEKTSHVFIHSCEWLFETSTILKIDSIEIVFLYIFLVELFKITVVGHF